MKSVELYLLNSTYTLDQYLSFIYEHFNDGSALWLSVKRLSPELESIEALVAEGVVNSLD